MRTLCSWMMLFLPLVYATIDQLTDDQFLVTSVRMVESTDQNNALQACEAASTTVSSTTFVSVIAGVNWLTTKIPKRFVYLCQQKERIQDVRRFPHIKFALQRILVLEQDDDRCPGAMVRLFQPRAGVLVCLQITTAANLLETGQFLTDVTVTTARTYNNEIPGWLTIPTSVAIGNDRDQGVYVSFKRPVLPIQSVQVLSGLEPSKALVACTHELGPAWEQAGFGFVDQSPQTKAVVCLERAAANMTINGSISILTGFSTNQTTCASKITIGNQALCLQYTPWTDRLSFVGDLLLHRTPSTTDPSDANTLMPGNFSLVPLNLNPRTASTSVWLLYRKKRPALRLMELAQRKVTRLSVGKPQDSTKKTTKAMTSTATAIKRTPLSAKLDAKDRLYKFKILQLADLHLSGNASTACYTKASSVEECSEATTVDFINQLLDLEKPDLVVFTGDNVQTSDKSEHEAAMNACTDPLETREIPYAMVFGNHDDEGGLTRAKMMDYLKTRAFSYTERGPMEVDGVGNYALNVVAPEDAGKSLLRLYFLDSHAYPNANEYTNVNSKYDWIKPSQIAYYKQLANAFRQSDDKITPALMFFHIPLIEYASASDATTHGFRQEAVHAAAVNTNLFSTLVEQKDVKAVFVGHDHVNDYCYQREGIQLCYGGGTGFGKAYGKANWARRARVIEFRMAVDTEASSPNPFRRRSIASWKRHYGDLSTRHAPETLYTESE